MNATATKPIRDTIHEQGPAQGDVAKPDEQPIATLDDSRHYDWINPAFAQSDIWYRGNDDE